MRAPTANEMVQRFLLENKNNPNLKVRKWQVAKLEECVPVCYAFVRQFAARYQYGKMTVESYAVMAEHMVGYVKEQIAGAWSIWWALFLAVLQVFLEWFIRWLFFAAEHYYAVLGRV